MSATPQDNYSLPDKSGIRERNDVSEDRYQTLFNSLEQGFCTIQVLFDEAGNPYDYRFLEVNPAFVEQTGIQDAIGRTMREMEPSHEQIWFDIYGRIVKTGEPANFEQEAAALGRVYEVYAFRIGNPAENQVAVLFRDISDRRHREENLAFLAEISLDLAQLTNHQEAMNALGGKIGEHLDIPLVAFGEVHAARETLIFRHGWSRPGTRRLQKTFSISELKSRGLREFSEAGKTYVVNNVLTDPRMDVPTMAELDVQAFVAVPLLRNGKWRFMVAVMDTKPREWREDEIELINELTGRIWTRLERAQAERELHQSEERFRTIAQLVPDLLWESEPDGSTNWYNQQWREFTGQNFEQSRGWGWTDAIHPEDRTSFGTRYTEAVRTGETLLQECRIRRQDGEYRWFAVHAMPLKDETGKVIKMYAAAQDITLQRDAHRSLEIEVRKRTEELEATNRELGEANEQLLRSNEQLAQYAYVASHDLQEPLRKILVYSSILSTSPEIKPEHQDLIRKISSASERMRQLILSLLDFSRLVRSDTIFNSVDLNLVVKKVLSDFDLAAREKQAHFELSELPVIDAVELQMNQLFYNLIGNSLKFIRADETPLVRIYSEAVTESELKKHIKTPIPFARYHKICVQDNGIGFEPEFVEQIFEIFKRLHSRDTYPGTGIGLALCKKIIVNHGGALYAESTPGMGARFSIIVPEKQTATLRVREE